MCLSWKSDIFQTNKINPGVNMNRTEGFEGLKALTFLKSLMGKAVNAASLCCGSVQSRYLQ